VVELDGTAIVEELLKIKELVVVEGAADEVDMSELLVEEATDEVDMSELLVDEVSDVVELATIDKLLEVDETIGVELLDDDEVGMETLLEAEATVTTIDVVSAKVVKRTAEEGELEVERSEVVRKVALELLDGMVTVVVFATEVRTNEEVLELAEVGTSVVVLLVGVAEGVEDATLELLDDVIALEDEVKGAAVVVLVYRMLLVDHEVKGASVVVLVYRALLVNDEVMGATVVVLVYRTLLVSDVETVDVIVLLETTKTLDEVGTTVLLAELVAATFVTFAPQTPLLVLMELIWLFM